MRTVTDLISRWPTAAEFARDIGIKPSHAQTMRVRGSIPVDYWPGVVDAAHKRGIAGIDYAALVAIHTSSDRAVAAT